MVKNLPVVRETWVRSLGWEDPLKEEMATHSDILAWKIPWTEEPGGLQSTGLQRVEHDWANNSFLIAQPCFATFLCFQLVRVLQKCCLCSVSIPSFPINLEITLAIPSVASGGHHNAKNSGQFSVCILCNPSVHLTKSFNSCFLYSLAFPLTSLLAS